MTARRARRLFAGAVATVALAVAASVALAAQSANGQTVSTDHGVAKTIPLSGTSDLGVASFNITGGPSHGALDLPTTGPMVCVPNGGTFDCSADVLYTPSSSYEGPDSFTYNVQDADGTSTDATVSITVGSAPIAANDPNGACATDAASGWFTTLEDTPLTVPANATCGLLSNDTDADSGDTLTAVNGTDGSLGTTSVGTDGGFTYTPDANANGDDTFTYDASDGVLSDTATVHVRVVSVNDVPSFTAGGDQTVNEDSGLVTVPDWATSISAGPNETQTLDFVRFSDDNTSLFSSEPAVSPTGTLTFTPAANAYGTAHVAFKLHDDGGTDNGGVDTSASQSVTITVNSVNDAPTFTPGPDVIVNQDTPAYTATNWATAIDAGAPDESGQTITFSFTSDDNSTLFSAQPAVSSDGTLTFTPAAGRSGTAHLSLQAQDDGGTAFGGVDTSAPASVTIRINANPSAVSDTVNVAENSHGTVMNLLANDTSLPDPPEALTITAVSSDLVLGPLHGTATVAVDGSSVTYVPTPGYYGSDFFRYYIADPYGGTDFATVFVTIVKDTTAPTVAAPAQRIRQGVALTSTTLLGLVTWSGSDAGVGINHYELQRSVNAGTWTNVTLGSPTATTAYVTYAFGSTSYRFRVRGVDANGNTSAWLYTATFHDARYEERNAALIYGGTWYLTYNSNDSGGAAKYTTVNGRSVTMTAKFRDIGVVTMKGPTRGSIAIYVDGAYKGTVSLKASTTRYRQVVWTGHFGLATHTIRVVAVGNVRLDFDCFVTLY